MQTWKSNTVPPMWKRGQFSVQEAFAGWKYTFMTDTDNAKFVHDHFPEHEKAFHALPYAIQRADVIRYMWLYVHGGLYLDMDYEVLKPFDTFLENLRAPLVVLHSAHIQFVLTNSLIAAAPGQTFFLSLISKALYAKTPWYYFGKHVQVMLTTGPMAFHHAVVNSSTPYVVLPSNLFLPKMEEQDNAFMKALEGQTWNAIDSFVLNSLLKYKFEIACALGALILWFARGFLQYRERAMLLLGKLAKLKRVTR